MLNNVSWLRVSARPLITDVTTHRAPSLDGFQHFRFYCSNFAVKYLLIIADILVITYTGELMFNIMICNITKIRIRLSICTSSEVVLSSICSLSSWSHWPRGPVDLKSHSPPPKNPLAPNFFSNDVSPSKTVVDIKTFK